MISIYHDLILSVDLNQFNQDEIDQFARAILAAMLTSDCFYRAMYLWTLRAHMEEVQRTLNQGLSVAEFNMDDLNNIQCSQSWLVSSIIASMPPRLDTSLDMVDRLNDINHGLMLLYIEMRTIFSGYIYSGYLKHRDKNERYVSRVMKYLSAFDAKLLTSIKGKGYARLAETFQWLIEYTDQQELECMRNRFCHHTE